MVTDARTNRDLTVTGSMSITSLSGGQADVVTSASASGGKKSSEVVETTQMLRPQMLVPSLMSGPEPAVLAPVAPRKLILLRQTPTDPLPWRQPSLSICLNGKHERRFPTGRNVTWGPLNVKSFANHDASSVADASAVSAEELGVGIAVP